MLGRDAPPASSGRRARRRARTRRATGRRSPRGRGCRRGRSRRASRTSAHAGVGLGAVADEVAQAPELRRRSLWRRRRAPPRRRGGCRGCRRRRRPASGVSSAVHGRGYGACASPWPSLSAWSSRRRRSLLLRPRDGRDRTRARVTRAIVLQRRRARAGARLPPPAAVAARLAHAGRRAGRPGAARGAAAAAPARAVPAPDARRGGRRRGAVGARSTSRRCRCAAVAHQRAKDVGLVDPVLGGWGGDLVRGRGDRRACWRARAARLPSALHAPLRRGAGGCRGRRPSSAFAAITIYAGAGRASTRSSTGSRRCPRATRAPTCSSSPAGPASTSARSTWSTPAARTTAANAYVDGLGHTKRVVLYDNLLEGLQPRRGRGSSSPTSSATSTTATSRAACCSLALVAPFGMFAVAG